MSGPQHTFDWQEVERARYDPRVLFDAPDVEKLLGFPEGQYFDRKSSRIDVKDLAKTVSAFSNTDAQGGVIAIGLHGGRIEGFREVGEAKLNTILRDLPNVCPEAKYDRKFVPVGEDSVLLLAVEYHATRVVELSDGRLFVRAGDSNRELRAEEIANLRYDKGEKTFEVEVASDAGMSDLDPSAVGSFADAVRETLDLRFDKSAEDILCQRHLGTIRSGRFVPRMAAVLLFGKQPTFFVPGCKLRFIRYEGVQARTGADLNVIKDEMIEGPIPVLIESGCRTVFSQLRDYQALQPDGRFSVVPEYPQDCVREAVVNACVHRSYSLKNAPVFVRMFDNRLEVESPGGFVPPVTPETVYEHHMPRNPFLMDALRYVKTVRCANEGTRRMRHLMDAMGLPAPEFTEHNRPNSKVVVVLRNAIEHRRVWVDRDLRGLVGESLAASLDENERRVLNLLAERRQITVSDAFRVLPVKTWHTARGVLRRLMAKGLVVEHKSRVRDPKAHFTLAPAWSKPNGHRASSGK